MFTLAQKMIVVWILVSLSALPAFANSASADNTQSLLDLPLEELMKVRVITASRYEENLLDTPATMVVIERHHIETRGYRNLIDLLRDLPGVDVQQQNDPTRYNDITFRGHFTHRKFMILQDGIRIDAATGETLAIADNFPLYHAERVEIVYGPSSAVYGADAFGGVINIITQGSQRSQEVRVGAATGNDDFQYYHFSANHRFNPHWSASFNAHQHSADQANLAEEYPALFKPVDATTFDGRVIIPAAQREPYAGAVKSRSFFARLDYQDIFTLGIQHSALQHLSSTGDHPSRTLFLTEAEWPNEINTIYAKYRLKLSDDFSTTTTLNYSRHEQKNNARFNNIFTGFNNGYKYALGERTGIEQQFNYQWDKAHLLTGGISYEKFYAIPRTPDLPYPYNTDLSPQQQNFIYANTDIPIEMGEFNYHNFAMYAQLHSRWNNHWSSVLGVRYDNNSRYEKTINPRLALTYQPTQKSVFKLLYGEAFRAPSAHESWRSYGSFSGERNAAGEYVASFFAAPNPNLQPEKLRNLELSFLHQWKHTQFMASAYYTNVDDVIMSRDEAVPRQYIPGAAIQRTNIADNIGTAKHLGLDLTLDYRRDLSSDWMGEFWGTYSLLEGSINNNLSKIETDLPFIAKHKLKLGATLTYQQKYFITPKWYLIGTTQTNYFDATDKTKRLTSPGYGVVDIHFGMRKVFPGLTIKASILNLLDRHYTHTGGDSASSSFPGSPQQPRTWSLGIEYQF